MRLARGQQLILRCGGTDAARQDTPPEPVKECEAGHSRDPSNIRLLFACRRARRVRSRLPPPPPSPAGDRATGSLEVHPIFLVAFRAIAPVSGGAPEKRDAPGARWRPVSGRSSREPVSVVRVGRCVRAFWPPLPQKADVGSGFGAAQSCRPPRQLLCPRASHVSLVSDSSGSRIKFLLEEKPPFRRWSLLMRALPQRIICGDCGSR